MLVVKAMVHELCNVFEISPQLCLKHMINVTSSSTNRA